jgi:hypothetical protein
LLGFFHPWIPTSYLFRLEFQQNHLNSVIYQGFFIHESSLHNLITSSEDSFAFSHLRGLLFFPSMKTSPRIRLFRKIHLHSIIY